MKQSLELRIKSYLKVMVSFFQSILPERSFNFLYDSLFPIYKHILRSMYFLNKSYATLTDQEKRKKHLLIFKSMSHSLVGSKGLEATYDLVDELINSEIEGDIIELGVAEGGCALLIGTLLFKYNHESQRNLWLFDSFEGLPEPTEDDFIDGETGDHVRPLPKGSCLGTIDQVKDLLHTKNQLPSENIIYVKGWFEDTVPASRDRIDKVAILRIDGDWYESVDTCLKGLFDKVTTNGYIIIDDYESCYGAKKATDEFIKERQIPTEIILDGRGGCYFKKP